MFDLIRHATDDEHHVTSDGVIIHLKTKPIKLTKGDIIHGNVAGFHIEFEIQTTTPHAKNLTHKPHTRKIYVPYDSIVAITVDGN